MQAPLWLRIADQCRVWFGREWVAPLMKCLAGGLGRAAEGMRTNVPTGAAFDESMDGISALYICMQVRCEADERTCTAKIVCAAARVTHGGLRPSGQLEVS